jgi:hypothetical protein
MMSWKGKRGIGEKLKGKWENLTKIEENIAKKSMEMKETCKNIEEKSIKIQKIRENRRKLQEIRWKSIGFRVDFSLILVGRVKIKL